MYPTQMNTKISCYSLQWSGSGVTSLSLKGVNENDSCGKCPKKIPTLVFTLHLRLQICQKAGIYFIRKVGYIGPSDVQKLSVQYHIPRF